jgi:hypothetical protein
MTVVHVHADSASFEYHMEDRGAQFPRPSVPPQSGARRMVKPDLEGAPQHLALWAQKAQLLPASFAPVWDSEGAHRDPDSA